jgi:dTDP-4-dehydrorhamnose reductase
VSTAPELWVGAECTVNRIGRRWRDQCEATGFARRPEDLDRLAWLGARRVRFPLLWERTAPRRPNELDWRWSDAAMARLAALGLEPVVGLLHHGSGPRYTSLVDHRFPRLFADYARRVAERHPHRRCWTPINEPLTTARFSCLYGHWYPHRRDDRSFVRALLNQVHATVLAMRAIRAVNPAAELVQTDDLGFTRSTPALAAQAAFDNERRWLAFDLLCGRVDPRHPLWDWLRGAGAGERELRALCEAPCPPDIIGINAYVTSERFLDDRLALHPVARHGGNGRQVYVDIETVRADGALIDGFAGRLREAHARYGLPLAITEVHLGCTREEQLRWLRQAWDDACAARAEGIDVRAVTAWAAFGTVDWSSLLTREEGHYEPGLWDARSEPPRLTALGRLARSLAHGQAGDAAAHPVLAGPGWWQRDLRLAVPPHGPVTALPARGPTLLIIGGGTLGRAFARLAHMRGLPYELLTRREADIAEPAAVEAALEAHAPWAVVNTAGYVKVDAAESDARQWRDNAEGPAVLAAACARRGIRLLCFSSDLVFPGDRDSPYVEGDAPRPLNAYGRAKAHAERLVLHHLANALVVRSAAFFGPWDDANFVTRGLASLRAGEPWRAAGDQVVSPTYVPDLVQAALDLLIDGEHGLWHLTNGHPLSWADFARRASEHARLDPRDVLPTRGIDLGQVAPRPPFCALRSERGLLLPSLDDALARYLRDHEPTPATPPPLRTAA